MQITRQFIMDNRTPKGSWTRSQIEALGIEYPPTQGWIDSVIGRELTEIQALTFSAKIPAKDIRQGVKLAISVNQKGLFD